MKKLIEEFKAFINRGNVIDMAVGVVVGGAFGKITGSLVNDIVMPTISWIFGTRDMSALNVVVREAVMEGEDVVKEAITIGFGTLLATILDFLLIALTVFIVIKALNAAKEAAKKKEAEAPAEEAPAEPEPTKEELLLTEIRDLLKNK